MGLLNTLGFITGHPLNKHRRLKALGDFIKWQVGSRLVSGSVAVPFVNNARLLARPGMTGATGNIYCGLHEFENMAFVLHFLRPGDLFVDVGANIGSYSVLASAVVGAHSIAIEPIPGTFSNLADNVRLNAIGVLVELLNIGVADKPDLLSFTSGLDTVNHVVGDSEKRSVDTITVKVETLDRLLAAKSPSLIKIDVEGYETRVLDGAGATLRNESLKAVLMELNGSGQRYGFNETALHERMLEHGFKTFVYSPFGRRLISAEEQISQSGNTLYIRNIALARERVSAAPLFHVQGKGI